MKITFTRMFFWYLKFNHGLLWAAKQAWASTMRRSF